jgi:hypothetical protein
VTIGCALGGGAVWSHLVPVSQHGRGSDKDALTAHLEHQVHPGHPLDQRLSPMTFYLAKLLEAFGFADVGYALLVGVTKEHGLG